MKTIIKKLKQLPKHGAILPGGNQGQQYGGRSNAAANSAGGNVNLPVSDPTIGTGNSSAGTQAQIEALAQQRANEMIAQMQQAQILANSGQSYSRFNPVDDIVDKQTQLVTSGLWSGNVGSLNTFFTSSTQTVSQIRHYVDVYDKLITATGSAKQFSIAYGNINGSGSSKLGTSDNPASKAIYGQYSRLLLDPTATQFNIPGSGTTDSIYVINVQRNRMKESLDVGNWELPLSNISASRATNATGSGCQVSGAAFTHTLIDDSSNGEGGISTTAGYVYNIVSGSIDNGIHNPSAPIYYGLFYPSHGAIVLDGKKLDSTLGFLTNTGSNSEGNNHFGLYHSISGSYAANTKAFEARNQETITSTHYFVRIKNGMYNFSNNPSYTTGSVGELAQTSFVGDPVSYITTVGLYNDSNELLAVAKLSKPLLKSFSREALVRVKLDF